VAERVGLDSVTVTVVDPVTELVSHAEVDILLVDVGDLVSLGDTELVPVLLDDADIVPDSLVERLRIVLPVVERLGDRLVDLEKDIDIQLDTVVDWDRRTPLTVAVR